MFSRVEFLFSQFPAPEGDDARFGRHQGDDTGIDSVASPGARRYGGCISFDNLIPGNPTGRGVNGLTSTKLSGDSRPNSPVISPLTFLNTGPDCRALTNFNTDGLEAKP